MATQYEYDDDVKDEILATPSKTSGSDVNGLAVVSVLAPASKVCNECRDDDDGAAGAYKKLPRIAPNVLAELYQRFRHGRCAQCTELDDGTLPSIPLALKHRIPTATWFELADHIKQVHSSVLAEPTVKGWLITLVFSGLLIGSSVCVVGLSPWLCLPLLLSGCALPLCLWEPGHLVARSVLPALDRELKQVVADWNPVVEGHGFCLQYVMPTVATYGCLFEKQMRVVEFVETTTASKAGSAAHGGSICRV